MKYLNKFLKFVLIFYLTSFNFAMPTKAAMNISYNQALFSSETNNQEIEKQFVQKADPVPSFLALGEIFNKEKTEEYFQGLQKKVAIIEIPSWVYGTWKSDRQLQDFIHIYGKGSFSGQSELVIEDFDFVGDIQGSDQKIYSIVSPGYVSLLNKSDEVSNYQINLIDERSVSMGEFIRHEFSIKVQVEPKTNRIINVLQAESKKLYKPSLNEASLFTESWVKGFTSEGKPLIFSHTKSIKMLIERHKLLDLRAFGELNPKQSSRSSLFQIEAQRK